MYKAKSWQEKFEHPVKGLPMITDVPAKWRKQMGGKKVLVPTPKLVDAVIRKVPKGKLITTNQIRAKLAADFKVDSTCPMTLGIFLVIISGYAEQQRRQGAKRITPYWRVIKADGGLNVKFVGGTTVQARRLRQEGHRITGKGNKVRVADYEKALVKSI